MTPQRDALLGTSEAARRLGVPVSTLTFWERTGVVDRAERIQGSRRRVWRESDLDVVRERIAERRAGRVAA